MNRKNKSISRRDLMLFGGVAALGMVGTTALSGCSSEQANSVEGEKAATVFTPLSEEERVASISDPVYMGASANSSGQELKLGIASKGQVANQIMIDHHLQFQTPQLVKISERVYCCIGNSLPNCTMIIGDTGIILIDSSEANETAQMDLDMFRTVTDKPVVAMIATHDHYFNGTETYVGKGNPKNIPIIAHEDLLYTMLQGSSELGDSVAYRSMMMFGSLLPLEGEDASVGAGLGAFLNNPKVAKPTSGFIPPNTHIPRDVPMTPMTIDGVRIEFYPMVSDSPANIDMYLPDDNIAISNHVWSAFYNMYTLRGTIYRDPRDTIKGIDTILSWNADAHVTVHGYPLLGADVVEREITLYRDCVQFVYDQTVRFLNKGYDQDQIVESIKIPAALIEGMSTKPCYGEVEHYIRGVYSGIIGWFGVDALDLHPISKRFESQKIVDAMGGIDAVNSDAKQSLDDAQYAWAAQLATYIMKIDPDNEQAKATKAQALRKMGQVSYSTNTRHWFTTSALELEGKITVPRSVGTAPARLLMGARTIPLDLIRVTIVPEKALGVEGSIAFNLTDEGTTETLSIHNCVAQVVAGSVDSPTIELNLTFPVLCDVVAGVTSLNNAILKGAVELVGEKAKLDQLLSLFEREI